MEFIFYGFLLLAFRFLGTDRFNLGALLAIGAYYLILRGIEKVDKENPFFNKSKNLLYVLMGLNAGVFVFTASRAGAGGFLDLVAFIIDIIVFVSLIKGIQVYTEKLKDKTQPIKLFKRWRMNYILIGIMVGVSIIMFVLTITSLPLAQIMDWLTQVQVVGSTDLNEFIAMSWTFFMPVIGMLAVWAILMMGLLITWIIFKILFLVSMFKIQTEYNLSLTSNPQQELQ